MMMEMLPITLFNSAAVSHMWLVSTGNVAGGMEAPNVLFYSVFVNSGYRLALFGEGKEEGKT